MKRFIIKILIYICIPLVTDIVGSIIIRPEGRFQRWKDLYNDNINSDLLIFGSSRALHHFNTKIIEDSLHIDAYNFGIAGGRIEISLFSLLEHLRICTKKPKYVTLEIDWLTIDNDKWIANNWQLFPYMLFNRNMYTYTHDYKGYYNYYYYIPLARYLKYIKEIYENRFVEYTKNDNIQPKGYVLNKDHWGEIDFYTKMLSNVEIKIYPEQIAYLNKFIDVCKQNNIQLNFVYAPEHYLAKKLVKDRDLVITFLNQKSKQEHVPFADMSQPDFCNDTTYFSDMRHLNIYGADRFTSEYYIPWIKELYGLQ